MWTVCDFVSFFSEKFGEVFFSSAQLFYKTCFPPQGRRGKGIAPDPQPHGSDVGGVISPKGHLGAGYTNMSAFFLLPIKLLEDQVRQFTQHSVQRKTSLITVNRCAPHLLTAACALARLCAPWPAAGFLLTLSASSHL